MKKICYILFLGLFFACSADQNNDETITNINPLKVGEWHLTLALSGENKLPVDFSISKNDTNYWIEFTNASEKILIKEVEIEDSMITFTDPIFNSWFEGEIIDSTEIKGYWYKRDRVHKIPFEAKQGSKERFPKPSETESSNKDITGTWEVDFSKGVVDHHYKAIGQFEQHGDQLSGTFMTETGDYRFLEGNVYHNEVMLSCLDGAHAFLFKATLGDNDTLRGTFWSGTNWEEPWIAVRNDSFRLTDPDSLTFLKKGYDHIDFSFPGIDGKEISLKDERYQDKVVIVNIMGPWCPNCKDEMVYLSELYDEKKDDGLEIIALSFDRSDSFAIAKKNIEKIKTHFGADYEFLIAGKADKKEAAEKLPMLNHIMSFPTSVFIDRKGTIRKIRTGFYGPGTGNYHTHYIEQTNDFIDKLLNEK